MKKCVADVVYLHNSQKVSILRQISFDVAEFLTCAIGFRSNPTYKRECRVLGFGLPNERKRTSSLRHRAIVTDVDSQKDQQKREGTGHTFQML